MHRCFLLIVLLFGAALARAETPPLLDDAIQKLIADEDHWAFTQTIHRFDRNGKPAGEVRVERYDPSKTFDLQWSLLTVGGRAPTAAEQEEYRAKNARSKAHSREKSLGDLLDLEHATLASETAAVATFDVPILKSASKRFPADKLTMLMAVDKARHVLTGFSLQPREAFRYAAVIKVEAGRFDARLDTVQGSYPPALVWWKGSGSGRVLGLFRVGLGAEGQLSDYRRVKPYNERFGVKIGDLKALNF